jgi:hypothetical protein
MADDRAGGTDSNFVPKAGENEVPRNCRKEVESVINALSVERDTLGRTEKARLLSIAITHLETAKLFIKETEVVLG